MPPSTMQAFQNQLDFEALLARENASVDRHEYCGGQLRRIEGSSLVRGAVKLNMAVAFRARLRGTPFRGVGTLQRVRVGENWGYPDLLIYRAPPQLHPRDDWAITNPSAIFEVLSPETAAFDRTAKFDEYALIEELSDYVLISTEIARVEHFKRLENGAWKLRSYNRL